MNIHYSKHLHYIYDALNTLKHEYCITPWRFMKTSPTYGISRSIIKPNLPPMKITYSNKWPHCFLFILILKPHEKHIISYHLWSYKKRLKKLNKPLQTSSIENKMLWSALFSVSFLCFWFIRLILWMTWENANIFKCLSLKTWSSMNNERVSLIAIIY